MAQIPAMQIEHSFDDESLQAIADLKQSVDRLYSILSKIVDGDKTAEKGLPILLYQGEWDDRVVYTSNKQGAALYDDIPGGPAHSRVIIGAKPKGA